ncbi:MAG: patatin-like phospholipase family protein [Spirochaetota bacterium]
MKRIQPLKNIYNNIKNLKLLNISELNNQLSELKELIKKKIVSIRDIIEYLNEKYNYPEENYENANKVYEKKFLPKKPVLVLSGGGARGMAHAGVFKILNDLEIKPTAIIGTSIGAIAGSLIADGKNARDLYNIMYANEKFFKFLKWANPVIRKKIKEKTMNFLRKNLSVYEFEKLKIPLYINTADLKTCQRVIISSGDIITAVTGSAAIPFIIESVERDSMLLTDGGVIDNFCVDIARKIDNDGIIIVDVCAATDPTSSVQRDYFLLQVSKDLHEVTKSFGKRILPIESEKDTFSFINNLFYMIGKRGGLAPTLIGDEIVITPMLEKMSVFEFDKRDFAYNKGIEAAKIVFQNFL